MSNQRKLFDVTEFCKRHLRYKEYKQEKQEIVYTKWEIFSLCELVVELFKKENTLVEIAPPVRVVGDIHGQYDDLVRLMNCEDGSQKKSIEREKDSGSKEEFRKATYPFAMKKWVFLGDYIDRGYSSLECICLVFSLKVVFPKQYILLRGNHETRVINFRYGFRHELLRRNPNKKEAIEMWEKFNEAFAWMPLACKIGTRILCMHGGISPELTSLDAIRNIPRPLVDVHQIPLALDLLWADPDDFGRPNDPSFVPNRHRGISVCFNAAAVEDACKRLNVSVIVRAHQMMLNGFKFFADRKLCTIFSAPKYMDEVDNSGAFLRVSATGKMSIVKMIKHSKIGTQKKSQGDEITRFPGTSEYAALADINAASKFSME
ncbi:unnamed protein product [Caenorhabditis brenneri]